MSVLGAKSHLMARANKRAGWQSKHPPHAIVAPIRSTWLTACTHAAHLLYECVRKSFHYKQAPKWPRAHHAPQMHLCDADEQASLKGCLECSAISWGISRIFNGPTVTKVRETLNKVSSNAPSCKWQIHQSALYKSECIFFMAAKSCQDWSLLRPAADAVFSVCSHLRVKCMIQGGKAGGNLVCNIAPLMHQNNILNT